MIWAAFDIHGSAMTVRENFTVSWEWSSCACCCYVVVKVHYCVCVYENPGELLLSTENTVAVILLRSCCRVCAAFFQPVWQRPSSDVLHWISQPVVSDRTRSIHISRRIWGQFLLFTSPMIELLVNFFISDNLWPAVSAVWMCWISWHRMPLSSLYICCQRVESVIWLSVVLQQMTLDKWDIWGRQVGPKVAIKTVFVYVIVKFW